MVSRLNEYRTLFANCILVGRLKRGSVGLYAAIRDNQLVLYIATKVASYHDRLEAAADDCFNHLATSVYAFNLPSFLWFALSNPDILNDLVVSDRYSLNEFQATVDSFPELLFMQPNLIHMSQNQYICQLCHAETSAARKADG